MPTSKVLGNYLRRASDVAAWARASVFQRAMQVNFSMALVSLVLVHSTSVPLF